jgi:hypothetical protein
MTGLNWEAIERYSVEIERAEGWDSLHTMRTNYPTHPDTGTGTCPFPRCDFRRNDPTKMFAHVHFGPHGKSYGMTLTEFNKAAVAWEAPA